MQRVKACEELRDMTLLYVEDEDIIRDSLSYILKKNVKKLYLAKNGKEGLETYRKYNDIDIIVSDIKMPYMSGFEMAKEIKKTDESQHIVITTAFGDTEYLHEAIEIGIDGYIIKPIERNQLFRKLNKIAKNISAYKKIQDYTKLITTIINEQKNALLLMDTNLNVKIFNNSFKKEICEQAQESSSIEEIIKNLHITDTKKSLDKKWFSNLKDSKSVIVYKQNKNDRKIFYQILARKTGNYILLSATDITDIKMENIKYKDKALKDQLTKLYNRYIIEKEKSSLTNRYLCAILLDIDNFKHINDTFGHPSGDMVLKTLASTISSHVRDNDLVIRWGGEEFLIILKNMKSLDMLKNLAEKLRKMVCDIVVEDKIRFTSSFGLACTYIKTDKDISNLIEKADEALYKAKQSGKNCVMCYLDTSIEEDF